MVKTVRKYFRHTPQPKRVNLPTVERLFEPGVRIAVLPVHANAYGVLDWVNNNSSKPVRVETLNAVNHDGVWYVLSCAPSRTFLGFTHYDDYLKYKAKYEE